MKKRKLIGIIISEVEGIYQQKLLKGIISQCYALDYDVAIFSTLIKDTGLPEYKTGEKNIYNLMNFDHFDGIIVAPITMMLEHLREDIEELLLTKCKCPVLYLDLESKYYPNINTKDRDPIEQITNHLIEVHGYKNIFCLACNAGYISTYTRVNGYKDALKKHDIAIEESRIFYDGDFWYTGGQRLARKIIRGEVEKPEAVVCINDHMAIGLVNELTKRGLRVPEDIAVTGYDATEEAATCLTSITTFSPPVKQTGMEAVCELTRMMTGTKPMPSEIHPGRLEIGQSCGCRDIDYVKRHRIIRLKEKADNYKQLLDSYMTEALTTATSLSECIAKFCYYLYLVKDYSDYYLCLCDNWDGSANNYSVEAETALKNGYTDKMTLALAQENTEYVSGEVTFDVKEMLPDLWKEREKPKAYYFTPIHFNDNCIGYAVLSYGEKIDVFDITYRNWSRNVMNALEFNRTHRKLYSSSFRDVLTGIYNRRGIEQHIPIMIADATKQKKKLYIIMADLDNLKEVNDQYGHTEGDIILTVIANGFQSCCMSNEICARIGGDEFLVIGIDDNGESAVNSFITRVDYYIEQYNKTSKKEYNIEVSMGAFCDYVTPSINMKEMVNLADKIMYANKTINKNKHIVCEDAIK
ncbi:MAG: GGDEF domain-containing protein [Mobilitalea sp.]